MTGRGLKIRTLTDAFGAHNATVTPIPYRDPSAFARVYTILFDSEYPYGLAGIERIELPSPESNSGVLPLN